MAKLTNKNRLSIVNPDLCKEWDYEKNGELKPENVSCGNNKKVWWKCSKCGYEWEAIIYNRAYGAGCPSCRKEKPTNKNRLSVVSPQLCQEWDYDKNGELRPEDYSYGSHKKVWWKCSNGHEWEAQINDRNNYKNHKGSGCPYCSGHKVNKENCLATVNPKLAKEWHPTKNGELSPETVAANSSVKSWWVCPKGHEYDLGIATRNLEKCGCPYCSSHRVSKENCLAAVNPKLSKEWHPTKNRDLTPYDIVAFSCEKIWWICSKGHEWTAQPNNRHGNNTGCPYCKKVLLKDGTSFASITEAYYYLKHIKNKYKRVKFDGYYGVKLGLCRYDFYLPQTNTYVEVTGFDEKYIRWKQYCKTIAKKEKYVKDILKANFKFVELKLTKKQIFYVIRNFI